LLDAKEITIQVVAPWYMTMWAMLLYAVLALGLLLLSVKLYTRRLARQKAQLERIVAERTEEVNAQADTIMEQNKIMTDSIRYAQRIQNVMLPNPDFLTPYFPNNFLLFKPHSIVSGDFYWFFQHQQTLWLAAADC